MMVQVGEALKHKRELVLYLVTKRCVRRDHPDSCGKRRLEKGRDKSGGVVDVVCSFLCQAFTSVIIGQRMSWVAISLVAAG